MDLTFGGHKLLSTKFEYSAVLHFSDDYMVRIESPFTAQLSGKYYELSPESDPPESFQPVDGLLEQT